MTATCNPSGERRRFVMPWAWLLAGVCLLASMRASAQYDFVVGTEPTVPVSDQPFEVLIRSSNGCQFLYYESGWFLAFDEQPGVIRVTLGFATDPTCNVPAVIGRVLLGPYPAGDYRLDLYAAPDGNLAQSFLIDTLDFTIAEARVPQPAVIPAGHPAGLAVLGGLALLLGWLRLRRGMG